ncbi:histone-lysine N-methyltransferase SETMAR-like, partial [Ixodes scapularis]|uniref:histone-lysine N-methyltransferase SETMAR-like n=1 Tax=Ixodes scapularis TaxID=6945 RepID=UPI001C380915
MSTVYGARCFSQKNVCKWAKLFKEGRSSVEDEDRHGRPTEVRSPEVIESVNDLIQSDRRVTEDGIARTLSLSVGTAHKIVHDDLGYSKVSSRWVPKMLTAEHKQRRVKLSQQCLSRYEKDGVEFLKKIATSDETWVWHFEPESKRQSMEWKHAGSPVKKFKSQRSTRKVMFNVFWDMQ